MDSPTASASPRTTRPRRQVAYYPHMSNTNRTLKPFSRSAAKRESVMALGSIEHLQHYFTKTGIAAEKNPLNKANSGMVRAIGGFNAQTTPFLQSLQDLQLPPSPVVRHAPEPVIPPYVKTVEIDPENLRPGVVEDLGVIEQSWWLLDGEQSTVRDAGDGDDGRDPDQVDVLDLLRTTTRAVRSVRNYLLSLPDDTVQPIQPQFRPNQLSSSPLPKRLVSQPDSASDPLSRVRRSALEVLTVLRAVEEVSRLPLSDDAYDAQSDHGEQASVSDGSHAGSGSGSGSGSRDAPSRPHSPVFLEADAETPISVSYVYVEGRREAVPVWEDEEAYDMNQLGEGEKHERWDERLVLGGGWLYRQDVRRADLLKERQVVARYLDAVDEVLFGGRQNDKRGWVHEREKVERERRGKNRRASTGFVDTSDRTETKRSNRRVVSTGMFDAMRSLVVTEEPEEVDHLSDEESVDDEELPEWAQRTAFVDDPIGRAHALLQALLPPSVQHLLPTTPDKEKLLQTLSSGQLLCVAYNAGVRRSRKPWGYVSRDAIHDIAALEAEAEALQDGGGARDTDTEHAARGWTFRRTDNLRLWAAALKLRYNLPVYTPAPTRGASGHLAPGEAGSPTPSLQRFPSAEPPVVFDAPLIARREDGWAAMLEGLVLRWVRCVVDERRGRESAPYV